MILTAIGTNSATALFVEDSTFEMTGQFQLIARANDPDDQWAIETDNATVRLISTGSSKIEGNIATNLTDNVFLELKNQNDQWIGKAESATGLTFSLSGGARWITSGQSQLKTFHWQDGTLDLRGQTESVHINAETIEIGNGATVHIDLQKADIALGSNVRHLYLEGISDQTVNQIRLLADSGQSARASNPYLIEITGANDTALIPIATYQETPLFTMKTTPVVTSSSTASMTGTVYSVTANQIAVGPSEFVNRYVDFIATSSIAHEQMMSRHLMHGIDHVFDPQSHSGLWVDATYGETDLKLHHKQREQTLESQTLQMGYNRDIELWGQRHAVVGIAGSFAKHDVSMAQGEASMDQLGLHTWIGAQTANDYRWLIAAHYQMGKSTLKSLAFLPNASMIDLDIDSQSYGISGYLGFLTQWAKAFNLTVEPFVMGTYYRIDTDESHARGLQLKTEDYDQSLIRAGLKFLYQPETLPLDFGVQVAWVHRFGRSTDVLGEADGLTGTFKTERLKESSAELALNASWINPSGWNWRIKTTLAQSEIVKPIYEVELQAQYRF